MKKTAAKMQMQLWLQGMAFLKFQGETLR